MPYSIKLKYTNAPANNSDLNPRSSRSGLSYQRTSTVTLFGKAIICQKIRTISLIYKTVTLPCTSLCLDRLHRAYNRQYHLERHLRNSFCTRHCPALGLSLVARMWVEVCHLERATFHSILLINSCLIQNVCS